jgi:adenylate cyclase, class 2
MKYEVEEKFPVAGFDVVESKLSATGAVVSAPQEEVDTYYAHPARDFGKTDEALRIRRVGSSAWITYKGPKVDTTTKTRREIELPLSAAPELVDDWPSLLEALGFMPVAEVRKIRRKATVPWQDRKIQATLDDVNDVGTFVELELVVNQSDLQAAKDCIASLAEALGLHQSERRSYLELLFERKTEE